MIKYCSKLTTYHVFFDSNHLKEGIMILQNVNVQQVQGWERAMTSVTSIAMYAVIMRFIPAHAMYNGRASKTQEDVIFPPMPQATLC